MSALDKTESILLLGAVALVGYVVWKGYTVANKAFDKLPALVDDARTKTSSAIGDAVDELTGNVYDPNAPSDGMTGIPMYSPGGLMLNIGNKAYQAGASLGSSINGYFSDGKNYEDLVGYVMPSTVLSSNPGSSAPYP